MIIHILWLTALVWTTSKCEPPVNSYLPPGGANNGGRPSPIYGPAAGNNNDSPGFSRPGGGRSGIEKKQRQPQDSYFPPGQAEFSNSPDTQYGLPGQNFNQGSQRPNSQDGSPSRGFSQGNNNVNAPNSQYGAPRQGDRSNQRQPNGQTPFGNGSPQSSYDSSNKDQGFGRTQHGSNSGRGQDSRHNQRPDSSYGPPPTGTIQSPNSPGSGSQGFQDMPRSSYQPPNNQAGRQPASGIPSSSYGTPEFGSSSSGGGSGRSLDFGGNESDEPAKYEFSYDVDDAQTGTNFHHSEQRDGDIATGEYNVVLPDGRKQVVEYEAGLQGYKPQIRYEGRGGQGRPGSGGNRGFQNGNQGYHQEQGGFGDSFQGQDNEIGYPRGGQAQNTENFGQSISQSDAEQGHTGYPRGGPNTERNGQGSHSPSGRFDSANEQFSRPSGGLETLNGDSQGYSNGRPNGSSTNNNGGFSGTQSGNEGYPKGRPQGIPNGGSRRDPQGGRDSNEDDANGYSSGRPNGPRGSGY